ncbi:MAG: MBL fold metallo-hydrolase [Desulfovibrio sp.]|jgi:L-ascorbate metabolism protein UlaG (beta-lactamase superfamily)|nr:MBL fold metallo-hydrolase [Desulfovibrio sp.]
MFRQFGTFPSAAEEARYARLPYYEKRAFHGPEPTPYYPERTTGGSWFKRFLLPDPSAPARPLPYLPLDARSFAAQPSDLAVYWLGHASLIIELEGRRLLVDPIFGNAAPLPGIVRRYVEPPLKRENLPPAEYVLITHDHFDHLEYATMRALRGRNTLFVVPLGVGAHLRGWGIPAERIRELGWGESLVRDGLEIISEPAVHFSGRTPSTRNKSLWTAYVLKGRHARIFICGDSGYGAHFKNIGVRHGPFDAAFVEIDAWNPGWPNSHLFPEEVIRVSEDIGAQALIPVHWGVFPLGLHTWNESIELLAGLADGHGGVTLLTPLMGVKLVPGQTPTRAWWRDAG